MKKKSAAGPVKDRLQNLFKQKGFLAASVCAAYMALPVVTAFMPGVSVAWAAPDPGEVLRDLQRNDPGIQLNQAREYMERQRVAQQMEEDQNKKRTQVETDVKTPEETAAALTFTLTKVETGASEVLTETELQNITAPYISKTVSLSDLYAITGAINKLYADKGYMICKAYLPPQRIHGGVVQIKLLEGKTGLVTLQGLKHTREKYVTARVPLKPGTVANTAALNKELQRFNGTNDVQLRVIVHAGKEPGTTDYEIVAYEPKQNQFVTVYLDNNGYETSGRFRQGLYYNIRSLTGMRDSLRLNYQRSQGTNLYGLGYSVPVGKMGTRLDIDYSTNTTKIIKGEAKPLDVKGDAYAMSRAIRHPLRVDEKRRDEVGLQFLNQKSKTKWRSIDYWTEDKRNTIVPYISFTHYGDSSILYHKHSFPITKFENTASGYWENDSSYVSYQLSMLYQKKYKHGQMFSARLDGQLADDKDRSSADRFYLGGTNSVRGYEESFIGGNKGATLGLTYQVPLDKKHRLNAFTFFDYGWISDDIDLNASSYSAYSTGLGLSASIRNVYASLTLGIPLKREFEFTTKKVSNTRFDFVMSATF
ncbi:MAG: ShlB/FhaC/HecB family hemolysin secretion/activation protein [Acidaminococcaceae bacterium]|nr:ShlB/FhaC/HecB family hemolysin secretion/activation protein [Acidaminococcaceae bacterium]